VSELRGNDRKVVLIQPTPFSRTIDPLSCLSQADVVEECRFVAPAQPSGLARLYRRLDQQDDHVWSLDLDQLVCPYFPICDPIVDHQVVRVDAEHLTVAFSTSLGPELDALFKQNGIIR
jgi:hypothetical protein